MIKLSRDYAFSLGYVEKNNFTLLVDMTHRRFDMIALLALHLCTNFRSIGSVIVKKS